MDIPFYFTVYAIQIRETEWYMNVEICAKCHLIIEQIGKKKKN